MTVFIVDDSAILRVRIVRMLSEIQDIHFIGQAESRDDAIERISRSNPDIVILDIHLKQGNGIEVLNALRNSGITSTIIMLTSYPYQQYKETSFQAGANYFLHKATEFCNLPELVKMLLSKQTAISMA